MSQCRFMPDTSDIISKTQVALEELHATERTVDRYRFRAVDPLPYIALSRRNIKFSRAAVRAWIARHTIGEVAR